MRTSDYKRKGVIELKIRKNRNVNPGCMMHLFVVAAFLLFLFAFWYLSDSVRALEEDMSTQMVYTTQKHCGLCILSPESCGIQCGCIENIHWFADV